MSTLAATAAAYDPDGDGSNDWNISFWDTTTPTPLPDLSLFDVFVIGSEGDSFGTGIDESAVIAASPQIAAARGSRTFLTGQDADFHYRGFPGPIDDGPRGFLIDAVNRAASGAGLGIVSLPDGVSGTGSLWWTAEGSFLKAELEGFNQYFQDDSVFLGVGQEGFPVNEGLTSAGLSNWSISSHAGFLASIPGYETIDFEDAGSGGRAITIVTEGFADAPTDPTDPDNPEVRGEIPLPAPVAPLALGLAGLGVLRGRRKAG